MIKALFAVLVSVLPLMGTSYSMDYSSDYSYDISYHDYSMDFSISVNFETEEPSSIPTYAPTFVPTEVPTSTPSCQPSSTPTSGPSAQPTRTRSPSFVPTKRPTQIPTRFPSRVPTTVPTSAPTDVYDTLRASEHTDECIADCSYPGMTTEPADWDEVDFCAFYASTDCDLAGVKGYSCSPTCLDDCADVFCDVFAAMVYACGGVSGTVENKTATEGICLGSYGSSAPTQTQMTFTTSMTLANTDAATLQNDMDSQQAAIEAMSASMSGVPSSQITITGITDARRRQLLKSSVNTMAGGVAIDFKIIAILEQLGFDAHGASDAYTSLTSQISSSVQSGQYLNNLQAAAQNLGVTTYDTTSVDESSLDFGDYELEGIVTYSPSVAPINPNADTGSDNDNGLSGGAIAGIVIACVVVCVVGVFAYYWFYLRAATTKNMEHEYENAGLQEGSSKKSGVELKGSASGSGRKEQTRIDL